MISEVFLVLLVVDDEANYCLICELLNPIKTIQVELDWVTTESAASEAIYERSYDAYLVDAQLLQLSSNNRQQVWLNPGNTVPVIWLTDTPETGITALASGAADYLVYAQLSAPLLERSLRLTIAYARSQYQRKAGKSQHQTQLEKLNHTSINRKTVRYLCNDLSECKYAESAIRRTNAQLEQRVRERTAELQRINQELTQEIQERQRVENALRDSEERFRQLAENIGSVFWMIKPDLSELLYVSPMYEQIWGRSCESFYQNPYSWLDTIHPSDRTSVEMDVAQVIQSDYHQGRLDIEYRIVRPDGSIRWIHARAFPIRNQAGNVYRVAGISEDITEQKRVEEELHQNKLFAEKIANASPQLLYLYDLITGVNVYVNQQSVEILGYTADEIKQAGVKFFLDTIHPDDLPLLKELPNSFTTLADNEVFEQEYRIRHKNGSWRWLRSRDIIFRRCANGLPEKILGCAIDITAHKEIEFQLRESESRLSTIVNSISDGILIVDQQGIVEFANPSAEKLFNQPLKNLVNHEFGLPIVVGETAELGIVRPGGKLGIGEMSIAKTRWQGERVYVVSLRDITERRHAEEALRESEERFRQLADNIQDVFWLFEPYSNQILYVSPAYEQVWGGLIGSLYMDFNNWLDTVHPDDREFVIAKISKYRQGELITQDYRIVRPDGEIRWICDRAFPIKNEWGEVIRVAGIAEDITDRKRTEDELQQYRDRLQVLVEQRTAQLLAANQTLQQEIAERQKAESAIRFQARLLEVVEHAIIATDLSGFITYWNRFAETLYGWSVTEVMGRNIIDIAPSKTSQFQAIEIMSNLNQGKSWSGEFCVQRRDGTAFPALVTDSPIYDEEGQLIGIVGISVDISERKQLEEALRKANSELGITVEERTKDLGSAIERLQQEIVKRKNAEEAIRQQMERERLIVQITQHIRQSLKLDQILNTTVQEVRQLLQADRVLIFRLDPDKIGIVSHESVAPDWNSTVGYEYKNKEFPPDLYQNYCQGKAQIINNIEIDVTVTCLIEYLRELGIRSRLSVPILHNLSEIHSGNFELDLPQKTSQITPSNLQIKNTKNKIQNSKFKIQNSHLWGLLIVHQCREIRYWQSWEVTLLQQLATQVAIAIQQAELYRQLEIELSERKQAQAQLQHAKEAAEVANRAKSEFLANISHELRTPLNAILGFTQLMAQKRSPNQQGDFFLSTQDQNYLGIISRSGEHLLSLINDILSMSKIEAGQITLNKNSFDLYRLLDTLEQMFHLKAMNKGLQFIVERTPHVPQYIHTDESKLRQVLMNLLDNAIKFTQFGKVTLRVGVGSGEWGVGSGEWGRRGGDAETNNQQPTTHNQQPTIFFEVEDTGLGIAPEEINKLFEPFVQTETGRKSQSGTGLGLAISRRFVQMMGGDITINSVVETKPGSSSLDTNFDERSLTPNKPSPPLPTPHSPLPILKNTFNSLTGTLVKFNIEIQLAEAAEILPQQPKQRILGLAPNQPNYRILVVEDNSVNRQLLIELLEPLGFEVREAEDGQEAIALWENWKPHLIWMDMRMPVMDGYEATKRIRERERERGGNGGRGSDVYPLSVSPSTVIIAITASAFEEQRDRFLVAGCDDFVIKPFREEVIFEKMAQHLGVCYVCEELTLSSQEDKERTTSLSPQCLTPSDLAVMSTEWITELHQAARNLDSDLMNRLIEEIPEAYTPLAQALANLIDDFRFDRIMALTQP